MPRKIHFSREHLGTLVLDINILLYTSYFFLVRTYGSRVWIVSSYELRKTKRSFGNLDKEAHS